jgi:hypothetical protein
MTVQAHQHQGLDRFWPIVAAFLLGLIHPVIAAAFAFGMAVLRRDDRRVLVALVVIGALWLVFLSFIFPWSGGGESFGSTPR